MQTVSTIMTAELERIEREFSNPKSLTESIILKGVQSELKERWPDRSSKYLDEKEDTSDTSGFTAEQRIETLING